MRTELKKCLCICAMMLAVFGCKSKAEEQAELDDITNRTLSTTTYNYTKYELFNIRFMNENEKFDMQIAAPAESIFFLNSDYTTLEDGTKISVGSGACCFIWNSKKDKPVKLRVVWSVIFNLEWFEGEGKHYDDRASKLPHPGSIWCEGIVEILRPYPTELGNLFLHFLPDGTLAAHFGERGSSKFDHPLSIAEVKKHSNPLPAGQYCVKEIANPWYGIPRKPHME